MRDGENQHAIRTTISGSLSISTPSLAASGASLTDPAVAAGFQLQQYLDKYIDGYLFHDLESIANNISPNLHPGAAAYPMILTTFAGMELLGALLRPTLKDKFNDDDGIKYFGHYWKYYLSKSNPEYKRYGEIARTLVRNGLAHLFMTKPNIGIVKSNPQLHLKKLDGHLIIDAVRLYEDFRKSYEDYAKPVILDGKAGTQLASNRLSQIMAQYTVESDKTLQKLMKEIEDDPYPYMGTTTLPPTVS